jgi:hypothetical protein
MSHHSHRRIAWRVLGLLGVVSAFGLARPCLAIHNPEPLSPEEEATLTFKARTLYTEGADAIDHILYDAGLRKLEAAARIDVNHVSLQFHVARACYLRAQTKSGEEAVQLFGESLTCLQRIMSNPKAAKDDRERAEDLIKDLTRTRDEIAHRDERRAKVGLAIQYQLAHEMVEPLRVKSIQKEKKPMAVGMRPVDDQRPRPEPRSR